METIREVIEKCLSDALLSKAENTVRAYRNGLDKFVFILGKDFIKDDMRYTYLTAELFQHYPSSLLEEGFTKKTNGLYLAAVKTLINWMLVNDYIDLSVSQNKKIELAFQQANRKRENKLPRFPKDGEAESVLRKAEERVEISPRHERNLAIALFLYSTGCRNDEIIHLKIKDLDMEEHSVIVIGKGSKQRRVFFSTEAKDALLNYWTTRGNTLPDSPVFARHDPGVGKKIKPITTATIRNIVAEFAAAAGIEKGKFTPHYFRHAFAINVLRNTGNLALVQDLLGHADPKATRIYAKIYPDDLRKAHEKIYG